MRIGLISDTHNFLDPKIPDLFQGVDHILHAGDVGLPWVVLQLEQIAPVTVVSGNTDDGMLWRKSEIIVLEERRFLLQHIVDPHEPGQLLQNRLSQHDIDVVVFGHTHRSFDQRVGMVRFLNPGYSGKPKLGQTRSVAVLHCDKHELLREPLPL